MARYDRIARLEPPARDGAFEGWLSLRDLEGREREPELGRRALLRFLALRPMRRLLVRGLNGPSRQSLDRQLDAVREQLEQLPPDDADRQRLDRYLEEIGGRSPAGLVRAALEVGAAAEAGGHLYAAEEFCRTALEMARSHKLEAARLEGLRQLGRVLRERGEWDDASALLREAADLADTLTAPVEWARAMEAQAAVSLRRGRVEEARSILDRIADSDRAGGDPVVRAIAATGRCGLELAQGDADAALEAGWTAVRLLPPEDEARNRVLLNMAAAFRWLGLGAAAASCYEIVVRWAAWPEHRIEARLEHALVAAESGDKAAFRERRDGALELIGEADRPLQAMLHLGLGRGSLLVEATDDARDHLREAISTARDVGAEEVLERASELLDILEERRPRESDQRRPPTPDARQIAGRIESLT